MKQIRTPHSSRPFVGRILSLTTAASFAAGVQTHGAAVQPGFSQVNIGDLNGQSRAFGVAVADFNNDGTPDAVSGSTPGDVYLFLGDGNGSFANQGVVINQPYHDAYALTAGDFNNDDNIDIIVVQTGGFGSTNDGNLNLYLGNGNGTFVVSTTSPIGNAGVDAISLASGNIASTELLVLVPHDQGSGKAQGKSKR